MTQSARENRGRQIVYPEGIEGALGKMAVLTVDQIRGLGEFVKTIGRIPSLESISTLARTIDITNEAALHIVSALNYVRAQIEKLQISDEKLPTEIAVGFSEMSGKLKDRLASEPDFGSAIVELLSEAGGIARARKINRLKTGILQTAYQFETFLDLRPDYSPDCSQVFPMIPMVIFRVRTHGDGEEDKSLSFQIDLKTLRELQASIKRVETKLETLRRGESKLSVRWDS